MGLTEELLLVDTHAHLDMPEYEEDLDRVLARAWQKGTRHIVMVGTDVSSVRKCLALASDANQCQGPYPRLSVCAGIHPHEAGGTDEDDLAELEGLLSHPLVVAVGETGLDFYRDYAPRNAQEWLFREHIHLAKRFDKPLVIHCRHAHQRCLKILDEQRLPGKGGICHCFSGGAELAGEYLKKGFAVSIAGPVTFPKARRIKEVVQKTELSQLVLETDCPYLAPQAYRGKRNEPAYLHHIAQEVASLKRLTLAEVAAVTSANAMRILELEVS
jgi:TatD DNase family protein